MFWRHHPILQRRKYLQRCKYLQRHKYLQRLKYLQRRKNLQSFKYLQRLKSQIVSSLCVKNTANICNIFCGAQKKPQQLAVVFVERKKYFFSSSFPYFYTFSKLLLKFSLNKKKSMYFKPFSSLFLHS